MKTIHCLCEAYILVISKVAHGTHLHLMSKSQALWAGARQMTSGWLRSALDATFSGRSWKSGEPSLVWCLEMGSYKQDQWEELSCLLREWKEKANMWKPSREQRPDGCLEQLPTKPPGPWQHPTTHTPRTHGEFEVEKHLLQFKIIRNENKIIVLVTTLHTELV